jgi:hypothetical protein
MQMGNSRPLHQITNDYCIALSAEVAGYLTVAKPFSADVIGAMHGIARQIQNRAMHGIAPTLQKNRPPQKGAVRKFFGSP